MDYENLFSVLKQNKNERQAAKMAAYMQDKFAFLGIPKPQLTKLEKPFLKELKPLPVDWGFINTCWDENYREAQYVALDYLCDNVKKLTGKDLPNLKRLIITKSWWDTVDAIDVMVGSIILKNSELENEILAWSKDENIWLRRIAIDHQLLRKELTNTELLEKIIVNNFGSTEFFINKAIGWSLRDYSKTNPLWVKDFIEKYHDKMSNLSIREGSKYL
ncbi:MAG: DNA alkylation repair protein [Tannerella sp.]|jgi:3-methyladenine DNA glycosylase AlkD|nr:DNA alkylation repair protein [Tannerella sp.]